MERENLAQTCCEYDDLINLAHFFKEVVHTRALDYVDIVPVILDFDRYNIISLLNRLEQEGSASNFDRSVKYDVTLKLL